MNFSKMVAFLVVGACLGGAGRPCLGQEEGLPLPPLAPGSRAPTDIRAYVVEGKLQWERLGRGVGALELSAREEARLFEKAVRAWQAGRAGSEDVVVELVDRRLRPYRRPDGTVNWREAEAVLPHLDGQLLIDNATFLREFSRIVASGDPSSLDGLARLISLSELAAPVVAVAGAELIGGELARTFPYLRRHQGLLARTVKTNLSMAFAWSLASMVGDPQSGREFLVNASALGLSATLTGEAARALRLTRLSTTSRLALRARALGGWQMKVGEAVVIVLLADKVGEAFNEYLDQRAARRALQDAAKAAQDAVSARQAGKSSEAELRAALDTYQRAWATWRQSLFRELRRAEAGFARSLEQVSRRAGEAAARRSILSRGQSRAQLSPALRARLEEQLREQARGVDRLTKESLASYEAARRRALAKVYRSPEREAPFLPAGADFVAAHADASINRLQTYEDERAALERLLPREPEALARALAQVERQATADARLVRDSKDSTLGMGAALTNARK